MKQKRSFSEIIASSRIIRGIVAFLWISMMMLILTSFHSAYLEERHMAKQERDQPERNSVYKIIAREGKMWVIPGDDDYAFYSPPGNGSEKKDQKKILIHGVSVRKLKEFDAPQNAYWELNPANLAGMTNNSYIGPYFNFKHWGLKNDPKVMARMTNDFRSSRLWQNWKKNLKDPVGVFKKIESIR